jgi:hypothetical protein
VEVRFTSVAVAFILLATVAQSSPEDRPTIAPYFSLVDGAPAFLIACRDNSTAPMNSNLRRWREAIRVDGAVVPDPPGELGPGLSGVDAAPGDTWLGIVDLRQPPATHFPPVKFGASVRWTRVLPLSDGRHAIAVQCGGVWSGDFQFYWDSEKRRD